jgi:hypothetical protein
VRTIEVKASRASLTDTLGSMRLWLDNRRSPLVRFETASLDGIVLIKVSFEDDGLADEFRREFGGGSLATEQAPAP